MCFWDLCAVETLAAIEIAAGVAEAGAEIAEAAQTIYSAVRGVESLRDVLFTKSHTVGGADIPRNGRVRVDWEEPSGNRPGNVHVQGKGKDALPKQILKSLEDLKNLPKAVRDNPEIQRGVNKAFEMLKKFNNQ